MERRGNRRLTSDLRASKGRTANQTNGWRSAVMQLPARASYTPNSVGKTCQQRVKVRCGVCPLYQPRSGLWWGVRGASRGAMGVMGGTTRATQRGQQSAEGETRQAGLSGRGIAMWAIVSHDWAAAGGKRSIACGRGSKVVVAGGKNGNVDDSGTGTYSVLHTLRYCSHRTARHAAFAAAIDEP